MVRVHTDVLFDVSEFWEKENEITQFYVYRLLFIIRKEVRFNE